MDQQYSYPIICRNYAGDPPNKLSCTLLNPVKCLPGCKMGLASLTYTQSQGLYSVKSIMRVGYQTQPPAHGNTGGTFFTQAVQQGEYTPQQFAQAVQNAYNLCQTNKPTPVGDDVNPIITVGGVPIIGTNLIDNADTSYSQISVSYSEDSGKFSIQRNMSQTPIFIPQVICENISANITFINDGVISVSDNNPYSFTVTPMLCQGAWMCTFNYLVQNAASANSTSYASLIDSDGNNIYKMEVSSYADIVNNNNRITVNITNQNGTTKIYETIYTFTANSSDRIYGILLIGKYIIPMVYVLTVNNNFIWRTIECSNNPINNGIRVVPYDGTTMVNNQNIRSTLKLKIGGQQLAGGPNADGPYNFPDNITVLASQPTGILLKGKKRSLNGTNQQINEPDQFEIVNFEPDGSEGNPRSADQINKVVTLSAVSRWITKFCPGDAAAMLGFKYSDLVSGKNPESYLFNQNNDDDIFTSQVNPSSSASEANTLVVLSDTVQLQGARTLDDNYGVDSSILGMVCGLPSNISLGLYTLQIAPPNYISLKNKGETSVNEFKFSLYYPDGSPAEILPGSTMQIILSNAIA